MEKKTIMCTHVVEMRGTRVKYYNIQNTTPLNNPYIIVSRTIIILSSNAA